MAKLLRIGGEQGDVADRRAGAQEGHDVPLADYEAELLLKANRAKAR